jgi:dsRNA-specific ribonuclease
VIKGEGEGKSKKQAEQAAARAAWTALSAEVAGRGERERADA